MQLGIGSDDTGFEFKELLKTRLTSQNHAVRDVCTPDLELDSYHAVADRLASEIRGGRVDRAVLICDGAIGASVAVNKQPGVRAALSQEPSLARRGVEDDNLNFLVLPAGMVSDDLGCQLAAAFINALPSARLQLGIAPRKLSQILGYIKDNLDSPLTVRELSRLVGLSESQFSSCSNSPPVWRLTISFCRSGSIVRKNFCVPG